MTHETCDVLELLEDLGFQVDWSEASDPSIRRTVYALRAVEDGVERWVVVGDNEPSVVDAMLEQLDWDMFEDYTRDLGTHPSEPTPAGTQNEALP